VFITGMVMAARLAPARSGFAPAYLAALAAIVAATSGTVGAMQPTTDFPFMTFGGGSIGAAAAFSVVVSTLYLSSALLVFKAFEHAAAPAAIRFLARNSLIIVLLHMPLFYLIHPALERAGWSYGARLVIELVLYLPGLAWFSEIVTTAVSPKTIVTRLSGNVPMRAKVA
jgi:hypothetical protein